MSGTSNKLSSTSGALVRTYNYNASGSVLTSGATTHSYYNSGRMKTGKLGAAGVTTYVYNALGQRVKKSGGAISTPVYFAYDEAGHLIGEYNWTSGALALVQETVWLGDIPIATLRKVNGVLTVFYVHIDQLNTPRKVTNTNNQLRWKWDPTPFGEGTPSENPNPPISVPSSTTCGSQGSYSTRRAISTTTTSETMIRRPDAMRRVIRLG